MQNTFKHATPTQKEKLGFQNTDERREQFLGGQYKEWGFSLILKQTFRML